MSATITRYSHLGSNRTIARCGNCDALLIDAGWHVPVEDVERIDANHTCPWRHLYCQATREIQPVDNDGDGPVFQCQLSPDHGGPHHRLIEWDWDDET